MIYINLLKNIWDQVYDPKQDVEQTVKKYFHDDYEQCINGVILNRENYIHHIITQKQKIIIDAIDYKQIIEKENELFALYYPRGKNINNLPIEGDVIAYFRFENQQLFKIHGQVRLLKGDYNDVDMNATS